MKGNLLIMVWRGVCSLWSPIKLANIQCILQIERFFQSVLYPQKWLLLMNVEWNHCGLSNVMITSCTSYNVLPLQTSAIFSSLVYSFSKINSKVSSCTALFAVETKQMVKLAYIFEHHDEAPAWKPLAIGKNYSLKLEWHLPKKPLPGYL